MMMLSISFETLQQWQASGKDFLLVDVRETFEHDDFNIGGINIPLGNLMNELDKVSVEKDVVFYCAKGIRSVIAIQRMETKGYTRGYNLIGGLYALQ